MFQELEAVHARHGQVEDHRRRGLARRQGEALFRAGRLHRGISDGVKHRLHQTARLGIVVDHEHGPPRAGAEARGPKRREQILGAYGYAEGFGMERYVRDVLALPIYGGSSAIQRNNIVNSLGLPRN